MEKKVRKTVVAAMVVLLSAGLGSNTADAAKKIKISKTKLTLKVGQSKTLSVKNLSKKNKKKLKWSSSKKKVATVSKKGKVTAKKAGTAKITAKVGKKKYTCKVTVKKNTTANNNSGNNSNNNTNKDNTQTPAPPEKTKEQLAAEDRENLTALIKKQRESGALISEDLTDGYFYGWNADGRLTYLNLSEDEGTDFKVTGEIDVTAFTALETLKIDYNGKITGVKTTGVTTLKQLSLDDTAITSIDVTTNVNLESLSLADTQVSSLDVSKNPKLESLTFSRTKITNPDVTKNPALKGLSCSGLGLASLDVSKNPLLTHLNCTGNKFTTLDLSALNKSKEVTVRCDKGVNVTGTNSKVKVEYYPAD